MKNMQFCLISLVLAISFSDVYSQTDSTFSILDIKNVKRNLTIKEDWSKDCFVLTIEGHSPLSVDNVTEINNIQIIKKNFLQIKFRKRGGSGVLLNGTKIFCINDNSIYQVLAILTDYESTNSSGVTEETYAVKLHIIRQNNSYKCELTETRKRQNTKWEKKFDLKFDSSKMVFYNKIIDGHEIRVCNSKTQFNSVYGVGLRSESYFVAN